MHFTESSVSLAHLNIKADCHVAQEGVATREVITCYQMWGSPSAYLEQIGHDSQVTSILQLEGDCRNIQLQQGFCVFFFFPFPIWELLKLVIVEEIKSVTSYNI